MSDSATDTAPFVEKLLGAVRDRRGLAPLSDTMDLDGPPRSACRMPSSSAASGRRIVGQRSASRRGEAGQINVDRPAYGCSRPTW